MTGAGAAAVPCDPEVVWHDLECGTYVEDLGLWCELAGTASGAQVLDVGCGSGRVSLILAALGHRVTGLDRDGGLLTALRQRATDRRMSIDTVQADARSFSLDRRFDLALAPMQLLQLMRSGDERRAALRCVRDHLRPGGTFATALLDLDGEMIDSEYLAPLPEMRELEGWVFSSHATAIRTIDGGRAISLDRLRQVVSPQGDRREVQSRIRLALLAPGQAEEELLAAGLEPTERRSIPATDEYMGSTALIARRPQ